MKKLLHLKHWQLFLLLISGPVIVFFLTFVMIASGSFISWMLMMVVQLLAFATMSVFFFWIYTLAINLNRKLPDAMPMNIKKFKVLWAIPLLYIVLMYTFMIFAFPSITKGNEFNPSIILLIIPLHFFSMFCIFYCLYFVAKSLKAVELQRKVSSGDYIGEFFTLWFFPIGIWFIQPRVNKLFAEDNVDVNY